MVDNESGIKRRTPVSVALPADRKDGKTGVTHRRIVPFSRPSAEQENVSLNALIIKALQKHSF